MNSMIVISLQGCPVHALGAYGNEWIATPNLDRWASEGAVFDQHFTTNPDPIITRKTWWEHLPPEVPKYLVQVGQESRKWFTPTNWKQVTPIFTSEDSSTAIQKLHELLPTLLTDFQQHQTALLWLDLDILLPPWHIPAEVFEAYIEDLLEDGADDSEPPLAWTAPETGWFDTDDDVSFDLLHRSYAAVMTTVDAAIGAILEQFRDRGLHETATWLFTSDAGFSLGQHGIIGPHRAWLHQEVVQVPLMIRWPKNQNKFRRIREFTTPEDVAIFLRNSFQESENSPRSEMPAWPHVQRPHVVTVFELPNGSSEASLRTQDYALLLPIKNTDDDEARQVQLYEKPDDYWEVNDLANRSVELAESLEAQLRELLKESS